MLGNMEKIEPEIDHFWKNIFNLLSLCQGHSKSWVPSNLILSDTFPIFSWCGKLKKRIDLCWGTWRKLDLKLTIFEEIFLNMLSLCHKNLQIFFTCKFDFILYHPQNCVKMATNVTKRIQNEMFCHFINQIEWKDTFHGIYDSISIPGC